MQKKAFINIVLLGFVLISSVVVFIASTADDIVWENKYFNLKKITDSTALALAKHYNTNENIDDAETIADGILDATELGIEAKSYITYTWDLVSDPNNVIVTITNYQHANFWYRFLGKDQFIFETIESKANIISTPADELPVIDEVSDFMPFAINECGKDGGINPGDSFSFIYKSYDIYESSESLGFYGLTPNDPEPRSGAQSDFAHFKNEVLDFNRITTQEYLVDTSQDSIENDAQQLASALAVHTYDDPMDISIALMDCASTKDNIIISNLIPVSMTNIYCGDKTTSSLNIDSAFEDQSGEVFEDITWVEWVESKDCSQSGLFRIDLDIKIPDEEIVILEY